MRVGEGRRKGAVHGSKHAPRLAAAESQADFFIFLFYFDGEHPALMRRQPGKWLMARIQMLTRLAILGHFVHFFRTQFSHL